MPHVTNIMRGLENRQGRKSLEGSTPSPSSNFNSLCAKSKNYPATTNGTKGAHSAPHAPQKRPTIRGKTRCKFPRLFQRDQTRALPIPKLSQEFSTSFWARVQIGLNHVCWNWTGAKATFGYGRVKIGGRLYSTHRVAYTLANGPILDLEEYHGAVVRHSCDNPSCCNPAHLCIGDQRANVHDMVSRGRQSNGGGRHA